MHPLDAPGSLWVLSNDGKYLARPQAGETSHKKQISCRRQETGLPFFSRIAKDFASAEAARWLSARPLDPFGAHPYIRGRNFPQETTSLRQVGNGPTFLFPHHKGFRLCGGDQRAFRSPFGNLRSLATSRNLNIKQISCGRQERGLPFFPRIAKGFASAEATRGLSDRPLDPFGCGNPSLRGSPQPQK